MKRLMLCAGILALSACAPRNSQTSHYERWAQQDTMRRAEEAEEAKREAAAKALPTSNKSIAGKPAATAAPQPAATPPPPPPAGYDGYNSLGSGQTPPVKTATKSRAIKPVEEEDIY